MHPFKYEPLTLNAALSLPNHTTSMDVEHMISISYTFPSSKSGFIKSTSDLCQFKAFYVEKSVYVVGELLFKYKIDTKLKKKY